MRVPRPQSTVKERYHTLDMSRLGGLLVSAPRMGWILGFCAMASLGLPGLAGFWGEFPAILASYNPAAILSEETFRGYMVVAALGTVLAAGYLLWMLQKTAMGTPKDEFIDDPEITDVNTYEWIAWAPMLALILFFGLYPRPLFSTTDDAVVKSLTVDIQGEVVDNCLELEGDLGQACFDDLRDAAEAAGG